MTESTIFEACESMLPSDLSFLVIPAAIIIVMLVSYAFLLVKLKPSKGSLLESISDKDKEKREDNDPKKRKKQVTLLEVKKNPNGRPSPHVQDRQIPPKTSEAAKTETIVEKEEIIKESGSKEADSKKSFFLFGKSQFDGCHHDFGHLKKLPKNTPIPEECFGCPRILECLASGKNK